MTRLAALFLAAVVLTIVAVPAFAGWGESGEFSPGDAPPWATPNENAAAGQAHQIQAESTGTVTESPAGLEFPGNGYGAGPHKP